MCLLLSAVIKCRRNLKNIESVRLDYARNNAEQRNSPGLRPPQLLICLCVVITQLSTQVHNIEDLASIMKYGTDLMLAIGSKNIWFFIPFFLNV